MKDQMAGVFYAALGLAGLTDKDYETARKDLRAAVDSSPDFQKDFSVVYPLALAYAGPTPPTRKLHPIRSMRSGSRPGHLCLRRTRSINSQSRNTPDGLYIKYHAGDDGWPDVLTAAKAAPAAIPGTIKPAPTPAEQAHSMVAATAPEKMDFATWEFVLSNGSKEDQDTVWNAIKGKAVQMNGQVIKATAEEFELRPVRMTSMRKRPTLLLPLRRRFR